MLCRKRSRVVLTAHKGQNLSKSCSVVSSEQLRYTAETVKVKVTHRKCSNMFMNLLFIICTIDFPTRSSIHSFQSWEGKKALLHLHEVSCCRCCWRKKFFLHHCYGQMENMLRIWAPRPNLSYHMNELITQLANQMWFPQLHSNLAMFKDTEHCDITAKCSFLSFPRQALRTYVDGTHVKGPTL